LLLLLFLPLKVLSLPFLFQECIYSTVDYITITFTHPLSLVQFPVSVV
jgi:hypothetical protein